MASSTRDSAAIRRHLASFWLRLLFLFLLTGSLTACGGDDSAQQDAIAGAEKQIAGNLVATRKALTDNTLRNAVLLKTYADVLLAKRPELQEVVTTLRSEASAGSPRIARFQERLAEARATSSNTPQELSQALTALAEESTPAAYDASLVDSINLLADLSNGALSRIQPPAQAATTAAATSTGQGTGSQFVGNPNYGQWVQNSAGDWVWNFIGAYAALGAVNQGLELLNYKDWNRNRGSGYYASGRKSTWEYRPARTTWSNSGKKSYSDLSQQRRQSSFGASSGSTRPAAGATSSTSSSDSSRRKSSFFSSSGGSSTSGSSTSSSSAGVSSSPSSRRASSFSSSSGSSAKSSSYSSGFRSSSSSSRSISSGGRFGGK